VRTRKFCLKDIWMVFFGGALSTLFGMIIFLPLSIFFEFMFGSDYSNMLMIFSGSCGGVFLAREVALLEIDRCPESADKWEIYERVKNSL